MQVFCKKGFHREQQFSPLCLHSCGVVAGAGDAIPSAVRIPSETAVRTGTAVHVTLVELHLCYDRLRSNVELLLEKNTPCMIKFLELAVKLLLPTELKYVSFSISCQLRIGAVPWGRQSYSVGKYLIIGCPARGERSREKVKLKRLFWHFLASEVSAL